MSNHCPHCTEKSAWRNTGVTRYKNCFGDPGDEALARKCSGQHDAERAALLSVALPAIKRFAQPLGVRVELVDLNRDVPHHHVRAHANPIRQNLPF